MAEHVCEHDPSNAHGENEPLKVWERDDGTTVEDWIRDWKEGSSSWHINEVNPVLIKYQERLFQGKKNLRVFVPLCGKSLDLMWLADQGHTVVGVDFIEQSAQEFFKENNLDYSKQSVPVSSSVTVDVYKAKDKSITFFVSDIYHITESLVGSKYDAIFDRGSLNAINLSDRPRYADLMRSLLKSDGRYLIECIAFDDKFLEGFVSDTLLLELFGEQWDVEVLPDKIVCEGYSKHPGLSAIGVSMKWK